MEERSALRDEPKHGCMCSNDPGYFFFIIIQKLVTIDHKTSVPEFISCKLEGFFLSPFNDIFVGIFGNLMLLSTA